MVIILDFDGVLFDVQRFRKSLAAIFRNYNLDFFGTYKGAVTQKGTYSFRKHLLVSSNKSTRRKIKSETEKLLLNSRKFLFPDGLDFVKNLKEAKKIVLSLMANKKHL